MHQDKIRSEIKKIIQTPKQTEMRSVYGYGTMIIINFSY